MTFEYKVVPAPTRGKKAKGIKTPAARFANALGETINEFAAEGWEYLRADTLPSEERHGLTGRTTTFQNMLVFRRAVEVKAETDKASKAGADVSLKATVDGIANTHAPKLPSADKAQEVPDTAPVLAATDHNTRDVAAE